MEQQAKERLTGGVILVVLLVLLVPELLTGPRLAPAPTPAQPDEAPMRSYTMELGGSPHATGAPVARSTPVAPAGDTPTKSLASSPAPADPQPITPRPRSVTAAPIAPPVRASAPHPIVHASATWTVQLGTFSSRENAARLITRLKSHGFSGSIAESTKNGHKLFRVRVGLERDRAAAQKLLGRLKAAGERGGEVVPR